jgi:S-DNA-T family DNA segregation ATPase FtsK/SpoIIIE
VPLLYVPDNRRAGDGIRWLAWLIWRYRSELGPVFLTAVLAMAARALHARHAGLWPVLFALTAAVGGLLLAAPETWVDRVASTPAGGLLPSVVERRPERLYAGAVVAVAGCWLSAAVALGPGWGPLPALALWGTPVLAWPWWAHRRRRARVKVERTLAAWPEVAEGVGLSGSRVMSAVVDRWGWTARLALARGQTVGQAIERTQAIESGLHTPPGAVRVVADANRADHFTLRVIETDPHAEPIRWPGPSILSVTGPVDLGLSEDGDPVLVTLLRRNVLVGGIVGSGKSGIVNLIMANLVPCPDVLIWGVDLKGGMELGPWRPCLGELATTPREAVELLHETVSELDRRASDQAARGVRLWEPTRARPALIVVIDEYAELPEEAAAPADSMARRGRAVAVNMLAATQRPTQRAMGHGAVRSQMDVRICLRVREPRDTDLILGQGMYNNGWRADMLNAPGKFLISSPEHQRPLRNRAYEITDEDVSETADTYAPTRPYSGGGAVNLDKPETQQASDNHAPVTTGKNESAVAPNLSIKQMRALRAERQLWSVLSRAPAGYTTAELAEMVGMGQRWTRYRLAEHQKAGHVRRDGYRWLANLPDPATRQTVTRARPPEGRDATGDGDEV